MIRRLTAVAAILLACAAAIVLTGGKEEVGKRTLKIPFDNAFGLTEGGDVRVGGVKAGTTKKFGISKGPECQSKKKQSRRLHVPKKKRCNRGSRTPDRDWRGRNTSELAARADHAARGAARIAAQRIAPASERAD